MHPLIVLASLGKSWGWTLHDDSFFLPFLLLRLFSSSFEVEYTELFTSIYGGKEN
jgi:hypothetical protein